MYELPPNATKKGTWLCEVAKGGLELNVWVSQLEAGVGDHWE